MPQQRRHMGSEVDKMRRGIAADVRRDEEDAGDSGEDVNDGEQDVDVDLEPNATRQNDHVVLAWTVSRGGAIGLGRSCRRSCRKPAASFLVRHSLRSFRERAW